MYPCSLVQYRFQSLLTRNVSLFIGPIYVSVSTHSECILVPWSNIGFSLYSPGMYPCSLVQYMLQSLLTRSVSLFLGPIYVSVSTHPECILVHWSNICFSLHSTRMYPCSSVYSRIWKLPVIYFLQLPMYVRRAAMRGAPQCTARTSLIGTTLAKLSKQLRNITYRQLFNKHTILSCLFLKMVVYCNKQLWK